MHGVRFVVACRAVSAAYEHVLHGVMVLKRCQALIALRLRRFAYVAGIDGGPVAS